MAVSATELTANEFVRNIKGAFDTFAAKIALSVFNGERLELSSFMLIGISEPVLLLGFYINYT
jgi:hypothetical protein